MPGPSRRIALALGLCLTLAFAVSPVRAGTGSRASYIVVMKSRSTNAASVATERAISARFVYRYALSGFAARLTSAQVGALRADPRVAYVEVDHIARIVTTQSNPPWGLDRIDQRNLPLSNSYTYTNTGSGVTAYIIDTGIRVTHTQFGGRAVSGTDKIDGGPADDCNGHGTHVSGTVGGSTYGVAKSVSLVAVRVLNCSGSGIYSQVIAGVDWVTGNHQAGQPAVANMSLGGPASSSLDAAVNNSIADGVAYAIAAGNSHRNACQFSPARVGAAMTIGATNSNDTRPSWSNYGSCLDWFGPGVSILSAWNSSDTATATLSGTSMATPHTAGVAALYLQTHPSASPASVRTALYNLTTKSVVKRAKSANNHLLFTNL